uniref:C2H2-type domain-containing protein n=1 Tax=Panagrolaimus superbus TaxID=310955 RepID=A0A914YHE0_9BILA
MEDLEFLEHNINNSVDISLQQDENIMNIGDELFLDDIDIKPSSNALPKAVHQCNICNKIFVSFKGLQQHAIIHTDIKPFTCEICNKSFRFKSNLFEHRSIHSGFVAHACPIVSA